MELLRVHLRVTLNGLADFITTITITSSGKRRERENPPWVVLEIIFLVKCLVRKTEDSDSLLRLLLYP